VLQGAAAAAAAAAAACLQGDPQEEGRGATVAWVMGAVPAAAVVAAPLQAALQPCQSATPLEAEGLLAAAGAPAHPGLALAAPAMMAVAVGASSAGMPQRPWHG
jgi:hypothetical protein